MTDFQSLKMRALKIVGGGVALAHHDDRTWMVEGALPGEDVRVTEELQRSGIILGRTLEVLGNRHSAREGDPCPHAGPCGGCDWPHVEPEAGIRLKVEVAAEACRGHKELAERLRQSPIRTSPPNYRLRSRLHFDPDSGALGFYARRSNSVHPLADCRIVSPRLLETLERLGRGLRGACSKPVDLEWLEDLQGESAVCALRRSAGGSAPTADEIPDRDGFENRLGGFHVLNDLGDIIEGWGRRSVVMNLPIPLEIPVGAFFQGNRHLVRPLFDRIRDLIGPSPIPAWDLHGGVGFLAAAALDAAPRKIVLTEVFVPAATAAQANLPDATVHVGRTAESVLDLSPHLPREAVVLSDPPRAGMSKTLRRRLATWKADRILMLACDPATWGRDTAFLMERGYALSHVELFDLFPSTHHVEILALLEHR